MMGFLFIFGTLKIMQFADFDVDDEVFSVCVFV